MIYDKGLRVYKKKKGFFLTLVCYFRTDLKSLCEFHGKLIFSHFTRLSQFLITWY